MKSDTIIGVGAVAIIALLLVGVVYYLVRHGRGGLSKLQRTNREQVAQAELDAHPIVNDNGVQDWRGTPPTDAEKARKARGEKP